jgi:16S rRNA pseudouridine516 synthase
MTKLGRLIRRSAQAGKREVRSLIDAGKIEVNGITATEASLLIGYFDRVALDGQIIQANTPRYIALHKPAGVVSATTDPEHKTVIDLIDEPWRDELHLAGRLDRFTTGLVILTNDSTFSESLTEPGRKVPKGYHVETEQAITPTAIDAIRAGMRFDKEDITTHPAELELTGDRACDLTIYEGKHHQIKRMFARFDLKVTELHRYRVGNILLHEATPLGYYREIAEAERAPK